MSGKPVALTLVCLTLGFGPQISHAQEATAPSTAAGPAVEQPLRVGGAVSRPVKVSGDSPVYTEVARKARVQGVVILEAIIDEGGDVTDVRVLKGLPMGLDRAAIEAVQTWKFDPATLDGKPVKVFYTLTVNFHLGSSAPYRGPAFNQFLAAHPAFDEALNEERYGEAAQILDASSDPGTDLARIYLLLEQDLFDDAWRETLRQEGTPRTEALQAMTLYAFRGAQSATTDARTRLHIAGLGIEAADLLLEAEPKLPRALRDKSLLLREKAKLVSDPHEQQRLTAEADQTYQQYLEAQRSATSPGAPEP